MNYFNTFTPVQHLRKAPVKPGGLCWIVYAKWEDVMTWPAVHPVTNFCASAIQLYPGAIWYEVQMPDRERQFSEVQQDGKEGPSFKISVSGYLAGTNENHILAHATMKFHQYVILLKDRSGQVRMIGNADSGAEFTGDYNSGDFQTSRKRVIAWRWENENECPIYTGTVPTIANDEIIPPFAGDGDFSDDFNDDFNN